MQPLPVCSAPRPLTALKHVNLFATDVTSRKGTWPWTFASRKAQPGAAADKPDAVVIIAVVEQDGEKRVVLTREFRAPLGGYELSVPSGLVDPGETPAEAARRELHEETGLTLGRIAHISPALASSAGLTDETVALVYAEVTGTISAAAQDAHEDIEVIVASLADLKALLAAPREILSSRVYPVLLAFVAAGEIRLPAPGDGTSCTPAR